MLAIAGIVRHDNRYHALDRSIRKNQIEAAVGTCVQVPAVAVQKAQFQPIARFAAKAVVQLGTRFFAEDGSIVRNFAVVPGDRDQGGITD